MAATYRFTAVIHAVPQRGGAYIEFPYDIRKEFGRGRVKVRATFDGILYEGSIVNMGLKNPDGSIRYMIGLLKSFLEQIGKSEGDEVDVTVRER